MHFWFKSVLVACGILFGSSAQVSAQTQEGLDLQIPGQPNNKIAKLPVGAVILDGDEKCNRKQFRRVKKLTKIKIKCYGSVQVDGVGYLFVDNWKITADDPGFYQLVKVIEKVATPLGDVAVVSPGWLQTTLNNGTFEVLSVSLSEPYDAARGWPYLRYRVAGDSLESVPLKMFTAKTNPVSLNRDVYNKMLAEAQAKQATIEREQRAAEEVRLARRNNRLAASRSYSTTYSRSGISLGHNFATRGRAGCFTLPGLKEKLDRVVNEMEVYNNSSWMVRRGCRYVELEDPKTYQKVGWYNNGKFFISIVFVRT